LIVHDTPQWKRANGATPAGGPSVWIWTFKAVATGDTVLRLLRYESWIGKEHATERFEVKLHINGTSERSNVLNEPDGEIQKKLSGLKWGRYLNAYDNGREERVGSNTVVWVELKVRDEPGADWYIDGLDESRLKFIGETSKVISPKVIVGGAVYKTWYFKTIAQGHTVVRLQARDLSGRVLDEFELKANITDEKNERALFTPGIPQYKPPVNLLEKKAKILTMDDNGRDVKVVIGEEIRVELKRKDLLGSGGWYVDKARILFEEGGGIIPPTRTPDIYWTQFKAIAPGDTALKYISYRLGDRNGVDIFEVKVHVTDK
jgi:predicted secreted protein